MNKNESFKIDVTKIPPEVGERMGRVVYNAYKQFIKQPGSKELLKAQIDRRKASKKDLCG